MENKKEIKIDYPKLNGWVLTLAHINKKETGINVPIFIADKDGLSEEYVKMLAVRAFRLIKEKEVIIKQCKKKRK